MAYTHLRWSHGEQGLAEVDREARLDEILLPAEVARDQWRFWEAIRWIERGRRAQEPVLIQWVLSVAQRSPVVL
jgi:tyrosine-protein phosphatase